MRVLIVEEQLRGEHSHHLPYLSAIRQGAEDKGIALSLLCNERTPADVADCLCARPVLADLSKRGREGLAAVRNRWCRMLMLAKNTWLNAWRIAAEARTHGPYDVVLCLTTWVPHMVCLMAAKLLAGRKIRRVGFLFVDYPPEPKRLGLAFRMIKVLARISAALFPGTVFLAETTHAKTAWEEALQCPVAQVPHPVDFTYDNAVARSTSHRTVTFGSYGFARYEQGSDTLLKALDLVTAGNEVDAEFHVVWPSGFTLQDGSPFDRDQFPKLSGKVYFQSVPFRSDEYAHRLANTDWLILPYRPSSYKGRCSRVAIEACVMGIPAIYTTGTDLEEVISNFGAGLAVEPDNPEQLAAAIKMAVSASAEFHERAKAMRKRAAEAFSGRKFWVAAELADGS
jgi:glycosyltransferase involved in cell wall biosynthesis